MLNWLSERFAREALNLPEPAAPAPVKKRSWQAASGSRLFSDFVASTKSADAELRYNLRTIRDRSRELCRNNDYANRYLQLLSSGVVGENGFSLQSRARNERRPGEEQGQLDASGNAILERNWKKWGERCTVDGKHSWLDVQRIVAKSLARDGEILVRFVKGRGWKDGFALQLLEADYLDETYSTQTPGADGSRIIMGVELDKWDRPQAYHLLLGKAGHPFDDIGSSRPNQRVRIPAEEILHIYLPDRAQQTRGVPWLATAMMRLHTLDKYEESELMAARVAANKLGIITSPEGDGYVGDDEDNGYPIMMGEPATFQQLPAGMDIKPLDFTHPTNAFLDFHKSVLRGVASGLGVSYTSLSNNLEGVSYSSIRQGTLEERDHYRQIQQFLIQHLALPVCREWLAMAMSTNSIPLPIQKFDKFADNLQFRGRGFPWVDPAKEAKAAQLEVQSGFKSMNDIAQQYGKDIEEVFAALQSDKAMADRYGIKLAYEPFGTSHMPINPDGYEDQTQG